MSPIGYARTPFKSKFEAPRQPKPGEEGNRIELLPHQGLELALQDLEGFSHIWLLWWFHLNETWRPRVIPPRGPAVRRGLFATRSPHRPNPIGMTSVELQKVEGLTLYVGPLDLLDGTPIFDIKPYLPIVDSHPEGRMGWLDEAIAWEASSPTYRIEVSPVAQAQLDWLMEREIDLATRAFPILERDPSPHRTRRILRLKDGTHRMACGAWRIFYTLETSRVVIHHIGPGYAEQTLQAHQDILHREAQLEFRERWPQPSSR